MNSLAPTLQALRTERLASQRQASPHTITAYRDTFRLLLGFAQTTTGKAPSRLELSDLDAPLIGAFLAHLEQVRGNSVSTRNARLAAARSLFGFAALRHPEHAGLIQRVLAIPAKRTDRALVCFLTRPEIDALLASPDRSTWTGRRDHALLLVAVQTGLRVSELIGLRRQDIELGAGAHLRCVGKGRKQRATPLTGQTRAVLTSAKAGPLTRCSQDPPGLRSAATPSGAWSQDTPPLPHPAAPPSPPSRSAPMRSATPPPCSCCRPGWTPR